MSTYCPECGIPEDPFHICVGTAIRKIELLSRIEALEAKVERMSESLGSRLSKVEQNDRFFHEPMGAVARDVTEVSHSSSFVNWIGKDKVIP